MEKFGNFFASIGKTLISSIQENYAAIKPFPRSENSPVFAPNEEWEVNKSIDNLKGKVLLVVMD